ncbi:MAG: BON domain-containing protein [Vicinamibacterales bacterium]
MRTDTRSTVLLLTLTLATPVAGTLLTGCAKPMTNAARVVPDDAYITTRVKTALLNDPEISSRIDVETAGGVVTLSGAVKTAVERDKALAVARRVTGVSDVKSTLQVQ